MAPRSRSRRSLLVAALASAAGLATSGNAEANGFNTAEFGSDQGQPALGNVYSVYFNPGAMAGMTGSEITGDAVLALRQVDYNRSAAALSPNAAGNAGTATYQQANTGQASLFNVLSAPYLGFVTDFGGTDFRLGVAGYAPFGGQVHWDKNSAFAGNGAAPGAYDGPQRWQTIAANTASLYGTVAGAYLFEKLHLGVGVNFSVISTTLKDSRARNIDGSDDLVNADGSNKEGRSLVDVSGVEVGAAAGVWWQPMPELRIGASYTSQPNFGTMRLSGHFTYQAGNAATNAPAAPADLLQAYPDIIRLGGAYKLSERLELRLDGTYIRWSTFQNQCVVASGSDCTVDQYGNDTSGKGAVLANIPRKFRDSIKVRGGVGYWLRPDTELFGSVAVETTSVGTGHLDPLLYDSTRLDFTVGGRHRFGEHLGVMLAATYAAYIPVDDNNSQLPLYQGVSRWPGADGHYSANLFLFDVGVSYKF
jgi:long-chain fatty acid transport protein